MDHPWLRLLAMLATLGLGGCAVSPQASSGESSGCVAEKSIYVVNHGWHTGLVIHSRDLLGVLPDLGLYFAPQGFIDIGWGDEAFYRAEAPGFDLGTRALFWPTPTVLHLVRVTGDPLVYFADVDSEVIRVNVSEEGYRNLLAFVMASFAYSADSELMDLGPGLYGHSRFFRAAGRYHAFYTCNTWTADALAAGGAAVSSTMALTADSVMSRLRAVPDHSSCGESR